MVRIVGVELDKEKNILIAMTRIKGIGLSLAKNIIGHLDIDQQAKVKELNEDELRRIREEIEDNYLVESDLRLEVNQNITRLKENGSYRGDRHKKNLPVRGQRTKTNARTKRGRRLTVGSGRKPAAEKT